MPAVPEARGERRWQITAVRDWPPPTNVSDLRSFLGLTSYYRRSKKRRSATRSSVRPGAQTPRGPELECGPEIDYLRWLQERLQERLQVAHDFTRQA
ncbi:hypothetical protein AAFF_G00280870 [Aldrovandia affinis]|uniref:Uncharacterized protein n=1 Tax=Aldrovandia affinis TaxID=143900 RepID=A0AAD7RAA0_9TELE|nr:hypothetical protein AAFF_G00280870 [Aldrovandia affinis]